MRDEDENPEKKKAGEKHMFFGFQPNLTGGPSPMMHSGLVWNPEMLKPLLRWLRIIKKKPEGGESETTDRKRDDGRQTTDV